MIIVDLSLPAGKLTIDLSDCSYFKFCAHSGRGFP